MVSATWRLEAMQSWTNGPICYLHVVVFSHLYRRRKWYSRSYDESRYNFRVDIYIYRYEIVQSHHRKLEIVLRRVFRGNPARFTRTSRISSIIIITGLCQLYFFVVLFLVSAWLMKLAATLFGEYKIRLWAEWSVQCDPPFTNALTALFCQKKTANNYASLGFSLIHLRPLRHDNGYMDGRSQIEVHTDERTQVDSARSSMTRSPI